MKKLKIHGYSINEGYRIFEILDREELEAKIEELCSFEIYKQTLKKADGYTFSGTAYTYIDARDGEIYTLWLQANTSQHPFDSFYEIVLCSIETPLEGPAPEDLLNDDEYNTFMDWQIEHGGDVYDFIIETMGNEELDERIDNWIYWLATEFSFDADNIKAQLDSLYVGAYEIRELTAPDGTVWEVKIFGDSPECEVRVKGSEEWKDAIWSIFCENIGVDTDCLAI